MTLQSIYADQERLLFQLRDLSGCAIAQFEFIYVNTVHKILVEIQEVCKQKNISPDFCKLTLLLHGAVALKLKQGGITQFSGDSLETLMRQIPLWDYGVFLGAALESLSEAIGRKALFENKRWQNFVPENLQNWIQQEASLERVLRDIVRTSMGETVQQRRDGHPFFNLLKSVRERISPSIQETPTSEETI